MIGIEQIMDKIATHLNMDPIALRQLNYYPDYEAGTPCRTPYGQIVKDGLLGKITKQLLKPLIIKTDDNRSTPTTRLIRCYDVA